MLSRAMHQPETAIPVIVEMMSLPRSSRYSTLALTPQQIKAQALRVLTDLLIEIARTVPLLCVLEDAHWIDPSTQELLELVIGRLDKSRILLIVTHRPEYQLPAGTQGHASSLTVTRLGRRDAAEMARLALRDRAVSTAVVDRIVSGSEFNSTLSRRACSWRRGFYLRRAERSALCGYDGTTLAGTGNIA